MEGEKSKPKESPDLKNSMVGTELGADFCGDGRRLCGRAKDQRGRTLSHFPNWWNKPGANLMKVGNITGM